MEQILIIEDDFSLNQGLCRALKQERGSSTSLKGSANRDCNC